MIGLRAAGVLIGLEAVLACSASIPREESAKVVPSTEES